MASTTLKRAASLPLTRKHGIDVYENFGWFIDTHRDWPHIGTFEPDIHRGMCHPVRVDYAPAEGLLLRATDGRSLELHEKHLFITEEEMTSLVVEAALQGKQLLDGNSEMPTSVLRDPRKKVYRLRSLRQMVVYHERRAASGGGTT